MGDWSEEMQLEWAIAFVQPLEESLIEPYIVKNLMKIVTILSELEDNDELIEAWVKAFKLCLPHIELEYVIDSTLGELFSMYSMKAILKHRICSWDMLLEIVAVYGDPCFEIEPKLLNVILLAWEDINWNIRKLGANRLRRIIPNWKLTVQNADSESSFTESLTRLMTDEESLVKIDAFETITLCLPYFKESDLDLVIPPLQETIIKDTVENDEFVLPLVAILGQLLYNLDQVGKLDSLKSDWLKFYRKNLVSEDEEIRKKAAYNLPYFFTRFYDETQDPEDNQIFEDSEPDSDSESFESKPFHEYVKRLAGDESIEVRQIVASGFPELLSKIHSSKKPLGPYRPILFDFLIWNDEIIMMIMVDNLQKIVRWFANEVPNSADDYHSDSEHSEETKENPFIDKKLTGKRKINAKDSKFWWTRCLPNFEWLIHQNSCCHLISNL